MLRLKQSQHRYLVQRRRDRLRTPTYPNRMLPVTRMPSKPGFLDYMSSAFNARPFGMVVPPNWVGIAAFGLLGLTNPGFWILGAGLELGYLLTLSSSERFRRLVNARLKVGADGTWDAKRSAAVAALDADGRQRYLALVERCRSIIDLQKGHTDTAPAGLDAQEEGLGRLVWMYLRLLVARRTIERVIGDETADSAEELARELAELDRRVTRDTLEDELRRSLEGQADILRQRLERRGDADRQRAYIGAELTRIEHQVELIREQAALATDPELLSRRIDEIATTLGGTSQWIRDQRQVFGAMDDLLTDSAPPVPLSRTKESE